MFAKLNKYVKFSIIFYVKKTYLTIFDRKKYIFQKINLYSIRFFSIVRRFQVA